MADTLRPWASASAAAAASSARSPRAAPGPQTPSPPRACRGRRGGEARGAGAGRARVDSLHQTPRGPRRRRGL